MKKLTNKILAILLIVSLIGMSFVSDVVYAAELIANYNNEVRPDIQISNETNAINNSVNVVNNATSVINATQSENYSQLNSDEGSEVELYTTINNSDQITSDIMQELRMHISIYVRKAGYLKNVSVDLSDGNYEISKTEEEINKEITDKNANVSKAKLIRSVNGNVIQLNEIDAGDTLEFDIPIKYKKSEEVSSEDYNKQSQVVLKGIFVNARNEEKAISISGAINVKWTVKAEGSIKQELVRYLK